jgi:hypothetical protein
VVSAAAIPQRIDSTASPKPASNGRLFYGCCDSEKQAQHPQACMIEAFFERHRHQ